jgi:hypothetical protein
MSVFEILINKWPFVFALVTAFAAGMAAGQITFATRRD